MHGERDKVHWASSYRSSTSSWRGALVARPPEGLRLAIDPVVDLFEGISVSESKWGMNIIICDCVLTMSVLIGDLRAARLLTGAWIPWLAFVIVVWHVLLTK